MSEEGESVMCASGARGPEGMMVAIGHTGATGSRRPRLIKHGEVIRFTEIAPPVIGEKIEFLNSWIFRIDEVHDNGSVWVIRADESELPVRLAGSTG